METMTLVSLAMALAFCAVHLFIGRLRFLDRTPRSRWLSLSGGVAVAYVFLHILPEIGSHGGLFARQTGLNEVFSEALVYSMSLAGLALFYGVERATLVATTPVEGREAAPPGVFWLHIAATCVLVFIIGYLLNNREDPSRLGLALSFGALLLHFVTADYAASAHHPDLYRRRARWVLSAATLGGWALGVMVEVSELAIGCLFAFVGGGIVLITLKEELPAERESRLLPFLFGAALYTALVLGERSMGG